jgi:hypothetical protein
MTIYKKGFILSVSLLLIACTNRAITEPEDKQSILQVSELQLHTESSVSEKLHTVIQYPAEVDLGFPGYIVGIEKSPVSVIAAKREVNTVLIPGSDHTAEDFKGAILDQKVMFISHVVKNFGRSDNRENCALYNAYYRKGNYPHSIDFCEGVDVNEVNPRLAFTSSWGAIDKLKENIDDDIKKKGKNGGYSHVLMISLGWHTPQEKALRNMRSILSSLKKAGGKEFRPLVIGVTWPSFWESSFFDPVAKLSSLLNKMNDADEVGFSWMGAVLAKSMGEVPNKIPLVVIGHSFGARATGVAACLGPAITDTPDKKIQGREVDMLIGLSGAYSINRFLEGQFTPKMKFPDHCKNNVKKIILTASVHDTAVSKSLGIPYTGKKSTFDKFCETKDNEVTDKNELIKCAVVEPSVDSTTENSYGDTYRKGMYKDVFKEIGDKKIVLFNADSLVKYAAYDSGGGAHNDIYRKEMGEFLWESFKTIKQEK